MNVFLFCPFCSNLLTFFSFAVLVVFTLLLLLLLLLSHSFSLFLLLIHQRCSSTSFSNSSECFYVSWSWTDHLPRRNERHRKQSQWPLLLSIEWVYSLQRIYLVERSTTGIIRKLFLSTGCLCYNSSSDAVFLDGRFLLDADWGNLSLLLRCESLQH